MGGKYDTPTDGISRKVFDRYKDTMTRRYVTLAQRVEALYIIVKAMKASDEEE